MGTGHKDLVELLNVEDSLNISGRGLIIFPDFSVPNGWTNRTDSVVLVKLDGEEITTKAHFNVAHFNYSGPFDKDWIDKRWRIVVQLPDWPSGKLQVGTKLFVSAAVRDAIQK
jgi:hypothetical protein